MSGFESKANAWLAKNNGITTLILLGAVVWPIAWLLADGTDSPKSQKPNIELSAPVVVTLKKGALICYERVDWEAMKAGSIDSNLAVMLRLIDSGQCQRTFSPMRVTYLDPTGPHAALIQMPSGRTAFAFEVDIRQ